MSTPATPPLSVEAFESGRIDPEAFDQEAHVHVAWLYLQKYELYDAIGRFTAALRRLTEKLGVADKYNETISWFFMLLIDERRSPDDGDDWRRFRRRNRDLLSSQGAILRRYYHKHTLASERAKRVFVLPDRVPT